MAEIYTAADIDKVQFSTDGGSTWNDMGLHQADTVELNEESVKSGVNQGQQATAKKNVTFTGKFNNQDATVKGALETAEQDLTAVQFKVILLNTSNNITTNAALINIDKSFQVEDNFYGFTVNQQYTVDRKTAAVSETIT